MGTKLATAATATARYIFVGTPDAVMLKRRDRLLGYIAQPVTQVPQQQTQSGRHGGGMGTALLGTNGIFYGMLRDGLTLHSFWRQRAVRVYWVAPYLLRHLSTMRNV